MAIERRYERDVDVMLAEEFAVSPRFAEAFKALTRFRDTSAKVADVWVSKSNNLGESDLIVVYAAEAARRFAVLIEDKVDANLQPEQAARYRLRADMDLANGTYDAYTVVLCAPRTYISGRTDLVGFDELIALEQLASVIREEGTARAEYRASFLEMASSRRANAWTREVDEETDNFWSAVYAMASKEFSILEMKPVAFTRGSPWVSFRPHDMPTSPTMTNVNFKTTKGFIDLSFGATQAYRMEPTLASLLAPDMTFHQTGASTSIRISVPPVLLSVGFAPQEDRIRGALSAAARLVTFYRQHREVIVPVTVSSTPSVPTPIAR